MNFKAIERSESVQGVLNEYDMGMEEYHSFARRRTSTINRNRNANMFQENTDHKSDGQEEKEKEEKEEEDDNMNNNYDRTPVNFDVSILSYNL